MFTGLLSVIVPCYNESLSLPLFYKAIKEVLDGLPSTYELIFVNDGSSDTTLEEMKRLAKLDANVTYLSFSRNFGKEAAMYAGLANCKGEYVTVMDADLQDPPELLPQMLTVLESGDYDCAATRRADREGEPVIRSWFSDQFYQLMSRISEVDMQSGARDYRMMKRSMVDAIVAMREVNRFSKGIFGWIGFRTYWISFENKERVAGATKWNFFKLFRYALDGITDFSQAPLRIASLGGILLNFISIFMIIFLVIRKLIFGDPVAGWASTICIMLFIGGMQLLCLGIIGQYIAKIYTEIKQRPHYIVDETNREDAKRIG